MRIIVCTRDLDYGVGSIVKKELEEYDKDKKIKKIIVIGPKKLKGYSKKISFKVIPNKGKFFVTKEPYFAFKCNKMIKNIIQKDKINIIYTHFPIYAEDYKTKLIYKVHGLHKYAIKYFTCNKLYYPLVLFFHQLYTYFENRTMKHANKILFVGRSFMKEFKDDYSKFNKKFEYSPNKIDNKLFFKIGGKEKLKIKKELGIADEKINFLFVGRIEPMKGIDLLLKAIKSLKRTDVRLLVVGSGPYENELKKYSFVKYFGKVKREELYKYYNSADLFIFPSRYEPWGLVLHEAIACGTKVLATDVGDVKYFLKKELIMAPNNYPIIKKKLEKFLK
jgi:glycosyltransferase involved in cell wall biosynthesis